MVKINSLREEEIRDIGDAFADFEYEEAEYGMGYLGKGRQAISDYIIANALHVIPHPEEVLSEIRRVLRKGGLLIAPNFVHDNTKKVSGMFSKALSAAGVDFEARWSGEGYLEFLVQNGFKVKCSKQLDSTIPLMYAEVVKKC